MRQAGKASVGAHNPSQPGSIPGAVILGGPGGGSEESADGRYRYLLWRQWTLGLNPLIFVMLNPSTAAGTRDDPTIRRCIGFARREGAGGLRVINLCAFRTPSPRVLLARIARGEDVTGGATADWYADAVASLCYRTVFAWGRRVDGVPPLEDRVGMTIERFARGPGTQWVLGLTKAGEPRHPLMVRGDTPLVEVTDCVQIAHRACR